MEQGFDGWVRNRFHVESSDIPDIASHIDPNLFGTEPDWTLPSGVDDLFSWLTSNQDVAMDQAGPFGPQTAEAATSAAGIGPAAAAAAAVSQLQTGQQTVLPAPQQVSGWQLAYLQQAVQQPQQTDMQLTMPAQQQQQQQGMFSAGTGYPAQLPAAGMAFKANPALLQQQQQQLQPDVWGIQDLTYADNAQAVGLAQAVSTGAGAGAGTDAAHASTGPLQHAHSSGRSSPSSGGSSKQQQKGNRAPIAKAKAGGGQRKPRKVTDAQRAAHKRFRIRRKEQVSSLVAEVAAKQEQLQALEAEHEALTAKARALDQLVASAGDSMMLMQRMEALSLGSTQQQQQQQLLQAAPSSSSAPTISSSISIDSSSLGSGPLGSTAALEDAKEAAAAATAAICAGAGTITGTDSNSQDPLDAPQLQAGTSSEAVSAGNTAGNAGRTLAIPSAGCVASGSCIEVQPEAGTAAAAAACAAAALGGRSGSNGGAPSSPSAAAAASLERLEQAVRAALGRPLPQPLQQQQQQQRLQLQQLEQVQVQQLQMQLRASANQTLQLQGTVPALQRLVKSLINEIMQLVLQINKGQAMASAAGGSEAQSLAAAGALPSWGSGGQQVTAAAERLQNIRQQVYGEFRAFAATNRIDMCLLYTLNLDTGLLVRPPAGHWVPGAQLLMQRLDSQTLQDIVMAHKLYTDALQKVQQQRRMLLMQLHASLCDSTSASFRRYTNDSLYATHLGPRTSAALLLNAVDSNLRKEYVMEGVFQWTLNKLLPPLLAAELVVTSYPFLTDLHHLAEELRRLIPTELDPTPGVTAVEQQRQEREQQLRAPVLPKIEQQQQYDQQQYPSDAMGLLQSSYQQQQQHGQQQYGQQQVYLQQQGSVSQRQVSSGMVQVAPTGGLAAPFLSMPCS